jgi:membrane associated rhomboid family serine protease
VNRVAVLGANVALFAALGAYVVASVRAADPERARRKVLNRVLWGAAIWSAVWAVGVPVVGDGDKARLRREGMRDEDGDEARLRRGGMRDEGEFLGKGVGQITQ